MSFCNIKLDSMKKPIRVRDVLQSQYLHSPAFLSTMVVKFCAALGACFLVRIEGKEDLINSPDPFIIVINHNQKFEALFIPGLLMHLRKGRIIHFMADWNFCLVPGVWLIYYYAKVIVIARKSAKPRFLNVFKPLLTTRESGFARAHKMLLKGRSVGLFPEGTTNRNPTQLLRGFHGAAQLSLKAEVPILPIGIRFPKHDLLHPIPEFIPMHMKIGRLMFPPKVKGRPRLLQIRSWHCEVMKAIADLSGKGWNAHNQRDNLCRWRRK